MFEAPIKLHYSQTLSYYISASLIALTASFAFLMSAIAILESTSIWVFIFTSLVNGFYFSCANNIIQNRKIQAENEKLNFPAWVFSSSNSSSNIVVNVSDLPQSTKIYQCIKHNNYQFFIIFIIAILSAFIICFKRFSIMVICSGRILPFHLKSGQFPNPWQFCLSV